MAKLIAPRKGHSIRNRQNQRNNNNAQPRRTELENRHNGQSHPQRRLHIQRQPKEAAVRLIPCAFRGLKHPSRIARRGIDFVPPAQANETAPSYVLQVVEIDGEEEDCEDEDEDGVVGDEKAAEEVDEET